MPVADFIGCQSIIFTSFRVDAEDFFPCRLDGDIAIVVQIDDIAIFQNGAGREARGRVPDRLEWSTFAGIFFGLPDSG